MRLALVVRAALAAAPARAGWTFCVAESGRDVWIGNVIAAARGRERLEADFETLLRARGVAHPVAQCPAPLNDKTAVFNAQFTAAEFHRKLGEMLHAIEMPERKR
jgi:hypothetical protein